MNNRLRTVIAIVAVVACILGAIFLSEKNRPNEMDRIEDSDRYVDALEICRSLANGDIAFVNRHLRYGEFVRTGEVLEFHYLAEQGVKRIVDWGNADARMQEIRKAGMVDYLGMSLLSDSTHEEKRIAEIEHDYPKIYDVVFQTNRGDGKVAIMDGGSNVYPYVDTGENARK